MKYNIFTMCILLILMSSCSNRRDARKVPDISRCDPVLVHIIVGIWELDKEASTKKFRDKLYSDAIKQVREYNAAINGAAINEIKENAYKSVLPTSVLNTRIIFNNDGTGASELVDGSEHDDAVWDITNGIVELTQDNGVMKFKLVGSQLVSFETEIAVFNKK